MHVLRAAFLCSAFLAVADGKAKSKSTSGGSKACSHTGFYGSKIVPLCEAHYPDEASKHVWVVQFYHQGVKKVHEGREAYEDLAKEAEKLKAKIGAVDCQHNQEFCAKLGVSEAPTTRVVLQGRKRDWNGAHDLDALKDFVKESTSKLQEVQCTIKGLFVDVKKDSAAPVCTKAFPKPEEYATPWMITFYDTGDRNKDKTMRATLNKIADKFGNVPPLKTDGKKKTVKLIVGGVDCSHKDSDCEAHGVETYPTTRFYAEGSEPKTFDSFFDGDELKTWANARLKEYAATSKVTPMEGVTEDEAPKKEDDKGEKAGGDKAAALKKELEEVKTQKAKATEEENFKEAKKLKEKEKALEAKIKKLEL